MKKSPVSYLACPYTFKHDDPRISRTIMVARFQAVTKTASDLYKKGVLAFSPITHSHPISDWGAPQDWKSWKQFDEFLVRQCKDFYILALEGWKESVGVTAELKLAKKLGLPIHIIEPAYDFVIYRCPCCSCPFRSLREFLTHRIGHALERCR